MIIDDHALSTANDPIGPAVFRADKRRRMCTATAARASSRTVPMDRKAFGGQVDKSRAVWPSFFGAPRRA
jgi:hypothetical protein